MLSQMQRVPVGGASSKPQASQLLAHRIQLRSRADRLRCIRPGATRMQLPIFPLGVVALPAATVPLMIFEARYRVLFNTLLWGEDGVEEGLVQQESPFAGTKKFGMCYVDSEGRVASIGTILHINEFTHIKSDGRLLITTKGQQRFEIKSILKQKPVLLCEVEVLDEEDDNTTTPEVVELAREVSDLLRATIKMNVKMNNIQASEDQMEPEELADMGPREVSFFVASFFSDIKLLQQNLLEEGSTLKRLQREQQILSETLKYYSAASALKSAFNSGSEPGSSSSNVAGDDR